MNDTSAVLRIESLIVSCLSTFRRQILSWGMQDNQLVAVRHVIGVTSVR